MQTKEVSDEDGGKKHLEWKREIEISLILFPDPAYLEVSL